MRLRTRLQRLERRSEVLAIPQTDQDVEEEWTAWCRGGCRGPLPPAGPRPVKYSPKEWAAHHRLRLALGFRQAGQADPLNLSDRERREVEEVFAFFQSADLAGTWTLRQQANLAPYRGVIARFLSDPGGGIVLPEPYSGESS